MRREGIEGGWVLQGSIGSRKWSKWWCFARAYGKNEAYEVFNDVGDYFTLTVSHCAFIKLLSETDVATPTGAPLRLFITDVDYMLAETHARSFATNRILCARLLLLATALHSGIQIDFIEVHPSLP